MGYETYFEGEMKIELKEPHLSNLKAKLSEIFHNRAVDMNINENKLLVNDEWKNGNGTMEKIVLYIEKYGKLFSGTIFCFGEDSKDKWEILIDGNKSFIREVGDYMTLNRSERKQRALASYCEANKTYKLL